MDFPAVFEVILGLLFIFYVLSQISSSLTSWLSRLFEMEAKELRAGLRALLGDSQKFNELMTHPWIEMLRPKQVMLSGKTKEKQVKWIPPETFAKVLADILRPPQEGELTLPQEWIKGIRSTIGQLPEGKAKAHLEKLAGQGVQTIEDFQKNVQDWFNDAMRSVSDVYKQRAQLIVILFAFAFTILGNIDSIAITKALWQAPTARAIVVTMVNEQISAQEADAAGTPEFGDVPRLLDTLKVAGVPLLWGQENVPQTAEGWGAKLLGLLLTGLAASQGSTFWYDLLKRLRGFGAG